MHDIGRHAGDMVMLEPHIGRQILGGEVDRWFACTTGYRLEQPQGCARAESYSRPATKFAASRHVEVAPCVCPASGLEQDLR